MDESLFALYNPVAPPVETAVAPPINTVGGFTPGTQNMAKNLSGVDPNAPAPQLPVGSEIGMFGQEDIKNVGITSGGEVAKSFIPEAADPLTEQENMFSDAYNKGYTTTQDVSGAGGYADTLIESGEKASLFASAHGPARASKIGGRILGHKKGETFEKGTMAAARHAKRDDRESDQEVFQKAEKEIKADLIAGGMKKGKARRQARRSKRQLRRGMRSTRKAAWKSFKGEQKLGRQDDAYAYEQKYS
tara:strand:+ start:93 stop:833 length:741 start_codon:yes stop_codon:yes gene_type:complete